MKEVLENRPTKLYQCEICGKKSYTDWDIKKCEQQHECPHNEVYFWLDRQTAYDSLAGMPIPNCFIEKRCNTCGYQIDRRDLSKLDSEDLLTIYNLFAKPSFAKLDKDIVDINDPKNIPQNVMDKFWEIKNEQGTAALGVSYLDGKGWYIVCPSKEQYVLWHEKD